MSSTPTPADPVSRLISVLRHVAGFVVVSSFCLVLIGLLLVLLPFRGLRIRVANVVTKPMSRIVLALAGIELQIEGQIRSRAVYVMNHTSAADPFVAMILCPIGGCGIAKTEIRWTPFFGQAYWLSGHLLVDRSHSGRAIAAFRAVVPVIERHLLSVWMWPEGTVSHDGRLLPLKRGFAHLAIATGLPVVPIVAHDAHRHWPTRSMILRPGAVRVEVLDPIDTSRWQEADIDAHVAEVQEILCRHLAPHQRPLAEALA